MAVKSKRIRSGPFNNGRHNFLVKSNHEESTVTAGGIGSEAARPHDEPIGKTSANMNEAAQCVSRKLTNRAVSVQPSSALVPLGSGRRFNSSSPKPPTLMNGHSSEWKLCTNKCGLDYRSPLK